MPPRLAAEVLAANLDAGLSVAGIAELHGLEQDYVYGRIRRLGLKLNRREPRDWTRLAEQLGRMHPREVAAFNGMSVVDVAAAHGISTASVYRIRNGA